MNQYKFLFTAICFLTSTVLMAQPKKIMADKIVAIVGDKIVLKTDIDNALMDMQRQGI